MNERAGKRMGGVVEGFVVGFSRHYRLREQRESYRGHIGNRQLKNSDYIIARIGNLKLAVLFKGENVSYARRR
jgi:hypothetical protein